ncbi:hypothetical protein BC940DRAFT_292382 [Gongronella butleri]|nr:hypothetical protein BC940DRAFT_292382 [Gongronella butleri]
MSVNAHEMWWACLERLDLDGLKQVFYGDPQVLLSTLQDAPMDLDDTLRATHQILVDHDTLGTSFDGFNGIQWLFCQYHHDDATRPLIRFLLDTMTAKDLDDARWGEYDNTTLHLVSVLGHVELAQQLLQRGASPLIANARGALPCQTARSEAMTRLLTPKASKHEQQQQQSSHLRPNYSSPDRFQQLRQLAESSTAAETSPSKSSSRLPRSKALQQKQLNPSQSSPLTQRDQHYFRPGRVAQTKQKVLTEEEAELEKQRERRRKDIALLASRSAVRNNPFIKKKASSSTIATSSVSSAASTTHEDPNDPSPIATAETDNDAENAESADGRKPKRNSKVINSLQTKSYVSTSIFKQQQSEKELQKKDANAAVIDPAVAPSVSPTDLSPAPTPSISTASNTSSQYHDIAPASRTEPLDDPLVPLDHSQSLNQLEPLEHDAPEEQLEDQPEDTAHWHRDDSHTENAHSPIVPSLDAPLSVSTEERTSSDATTVASPLTPPFQAPSEIYQDIDPVLAITSASSARVRDLQQRRQQMYQSNSSSSVHSHSSSSDLSFAGREDVQMPKTTTKEQRRRSGAQKDQWALELNSWATTLDREFSLNEADAEISAENEAPSASVAVPSFESEPSSENKAQFESFHDIEGTMDNISQLEASAPSTPMPRRRPQQPSQPSQPSKPLQQQSLQQPSEPWLPRRAASLYEQEVHTHDTTPKEDTNRSEITTTKEERRKTRYGSVSVRSTARYAHRLPTFDANAPENVEKEAPIMCQFHKQQQMALSSPPTPAPTRNASTFQSPPPQTRPAAPARTGSATTMSSLATSTIETPNSSIGKLYVHVNGVHDVLLPMPKDRTQVRCVISDGKYEYMSRYETLSHDMSFDYECIIDSHPDMIVTLSLHVRPDYVMRKPLTRLFSTHRKRKGSLSAYVSHEDGAIGQTRFAVRDMLRACHKHSYLATFHCFNAWHTKDATNPSNYSTTASSVAANDSRITTSSFGSSFSSSSHDPTHNDDTHNDQGVLKVIANFDVELLYLPVNDPSATVPMTLRDCDMAIKIQQWNETRMETEQYHKIQRPQPRVA